MTFNRVACAIASPIGGLVTFTVVRALETRVLGWEGIAAPLMIAAVAAGNVIGALERVGLLSDPYPSTTLDLNTKSVEKRPLDLEQLLRRNRLMRFRHGAPTATSRSIDRFHLAFCRVPNSEFEAL